jgi:hypothetical protein
MTEDNLFALIDPILTPLGFETHEGEEFASPPLDLLRYHQRPVDLAPIPWLGRASSVVAIVRQPIDIGFDEVGCRELLKRVANAVNHRYPPWRFRYGLAIGLTLIVTTPEPITAQDDSVLALALAAAGKRTRGFPLGIIRLNLGQEGMAQALSSGPDGLFPEPQLLSDILSMSFRRFLPRFEGD